MLRAPLPASPQARDLIRYATLAPNGHNTQPWKFRERDGRIDISPDLARRTPVVDPDDHHLFISLGCAAESLALAAAAGGRAAEIAFDPEDGGTIRVVFGARPAPGDGNDATLFAAIPLRQSTRGDYDGKAVSSGDLTLLAQAARRPGVDLVLMTDRPQMGRVRDLVMAGNSAQLGDPALMTELQRWIRFNPRATLKTGDGLFSAASGNPALPDWLGPAMVGLTLRSKSDNARYAGQIASSSGLAVFVGAEATPANWVQVGRACQRFALQATALGMKVAFLNQPVEVPGQRAEPAALAGLPGRRPDLVMRELCPKVGDAAIRRL